MTAAQERMMAVLLRKCASEASRHDDNDGWVEWWDVVNDWEDQRMPIGFVGNAASKVWGALDRQGLVEEHPTLSGLVRPKGFSRPVRMELPKAQVKGFDRFFERLSEAMR